MEFNIGDFVTRKSYNNDLLFRIEKIEDDINGNKWQIVMNNTQTNATVILDFAIENNKDFVWISNAIDNWKYRVKAKEFQKTKSR